MKEEFKLAIEEYQCSGCVHGNDINCYWGDNSGCEKHCAGTLIPNVGVIYLGMPKGFNRLGKYRDMSFRIYEGFEKSDWEYDMWNVPVWKHKNKEGHTIVRGFMPRRNEPFLHVFLEDCLEKIDCLEITQEDIDGMD
jgi:hypothetical protein